MVLSLHTRVGLLTVQRC